MGKATAFITGSAKGRKVGVITTLGAALYAGMRGASLLKRVENPDSFLQVIPGNLTIAKVLGFAGKKLAGDKGVKAASQISDVIATPGKVMALPLESFATQGKGSFAELAGGKMATQKILGEDAEKKINKVAMKTSSFGGVISNGLGKLLTQLDGFLNISGKIDRKLEKKEGYAASLSDSFKTIKNQPSLTARAKQKLGYKIDEMAKPEDIASANKRTDKWIAAAANRKKLWDDLSLLDKQNYTKNYQDLLNGEDERFVKASKDITDETQLKKIQTEIITSRTASQRRLAKTVEAQKILEQTKGKILEHTGESTKGKISSELSRTIDKVSQTHEDIKELKDKKKFWANPGEGIKKRVNNMTMGEVADLTLRYGVVAQQGIQTVKTTKVGLRTLKQLIADLTGKDARTISTWKALFGKASPMVKEARSEFIKTTLINMIPFIGGTIAQEAASRKLSRHYGKDNTMVTIGVTAGFGMIQQLSGFFGSDNKMLETYAAARIAEEAGQQLSANDYKSILAYSSKDIKAIGGAMNHNTALIAEYYAANNTPIAEVMKDINAGKAKLMELSTQGKEMVEQYNMAAQAAAEVQNEQPVQDDAVVKGKFTANKRNQPQGKGSFVDKATTSIEQPSPHGIT